LKTFRPDEWGLAREAAVLLVACDRPARAVEVWRTLLAEPLPADLRPVWLRDALGAARAAGDATQISAWEKELEALEKK